MTYWAGIRAAAEQFIEALFDAIDKHGTTNPCGVKGQVSWVCPECGAPEFIVEIGAYQRTVEATKTVHRALMIHGECLKCWYFDVELPLPDAELYGGMALKSDTTCPPMIICANDRPSGEPTHIGVQAGARQKGDAAVEQVRMAQQLDFIARNNLNGKVGA